MEPPDKKLMAKRILGEYPRQYREILEFVDRFPDLQETPAQFQERCGQIALACFWKEKQGGSAEDVAVEKAVVEPTRRERTSAADETLNGWWEHKS